MGASAGKVGGMGGAPQSPASLLGGVRQPPPPSGGMGSAPGEVVGMPAKKPVAPPPGTPQLGSTVPGQFTYQPALPRGGTIGIGNIGQNLQAVSGGPSQPGGVPGKPGWFA